MKKIELLAPAKDLRTACAAIDSGADDRNNIRNVLNTARLLGALYDSAEAGEEVRLS